MNRTRFIAAVVSVGAVAGLLTMASPAIAGLSSWTVEAEPALGASSVEQARQADSRPEAQTSDCSWRRVDHGPNEYAEGTPVLSSNGFIRAYEVAEGDTLTGIAERFCAPSSAAIFYANDMQSSGHGDALAVGQVLMLPAG